MRFLKKNMFVRAWANLEIEPRPFISKWTHNGRWNQVLDVLSITREGTSIACRMCALGVVVMRVRCWLTVIPVLLDQVASDDHWRWRPLCSVLGQSGVRADPRLTDTKQSLVLVTAGRANFSFARSTVRRPCTCRSAPRR